MMEDVVDGIRTILARWVASSTTLTAQANVGDTVITVANAIHFWYKDELMLINNDQYETPINIAYIVDNNHIKLTAPIATQNWPIGTVVQKSFGGQLVQGIYFGGPENITNFPAICVSGSQRQSEWMTIRSSKETYDLEIGIFVQADSFEDGSRFIMRVSDTVMLGLQKNVYPLVSDYEETLLTADAISGDSTIKVADTSFLYPYAEILIEDQYSVEGNRVCQVIDSETVELDAPLTYGFLVANGTSLIKMNRFIYQSWPSSCTYGHLVQNTMLKGSVIRLSCLENLIQPGMGWPATGNQGGGWEDPQT